MESSLAATEDQLVDSLSFKLPSTANYITSRDEVTFFPANGNEFSPTGVKILRFMLTGTQWLDPRSVRIQFKLNNRNQQHNMHPINGLPSNFFRRLRILAGGQLIEDIDYYNRVCNMLHTLYPLEKRINDSIEGFGINTMLGDEQGNAGSVEKVPVLWAGQSKVVLFPLMCGLFSQEKYLPLRFLQGLQIELKVVNPNLRLRTPLCAATCRRAGPSRQSCICGTSRHPTAGKRMDHQRSANQMLSS